MFLPELEDPVSYRGMMRTLMIFLLLCSPLVAASIYPELKSANGEKTIEAKPIAVVGDEIRFEKPSGKVFTAAPEMFSAADQKNLRAWIAATQARPQSAVQQRVRNATTLRVLFVGNSYSFKIPKAFKKIARSEGCKAQVQQITKGGWTLQKHANSQETLEKIAKGKWDIVVLQEQSLIPAFPESQRSRMMYPAAKKLATAVREAGAIPVFFQTWGRRDGDKQNASTFPNDTYSAMQDRLIKGYRGAALNACGAFVVPVGEVWSRVRAAGKGDGLYARDGSHPMRAGDYLGASVFYCALYGKQIGQVDRAVKASAALAKEAASACMQPLDYPLPKK